VMRDANADAKRRDAMAMAAAPYLHPKMSPVEAKPNELSGAEVHGIRVTFVRPHPQPEDGDDVAMGNSLACRLTNSDQKTHRRR
jgi:hypothetical protein